MRPEIIKKLTRESFDLLVIGGGATGAGIALDAASRGLRTALVEKGDFASGTSSRSTKLIHGGLRYLKQLEFGLVHETGRERAVVHRLIPHLVVRETMLLPIMRGGTYGRFSSALGVTLYDFLAGVHSSERRRILDRKKAMEIEPMLDPIKLRGGVLYFEYRTDDARLTIELIKTAVRFGAVCLNYCKMQRFIHSGDQISGAFCRDEITGDSLEIKAARVVNASGPWVDEIRELNGSLTKKQLYLTKGVHLVVDYNKLPVSQSVYFDAPDGRLIFIIPRGNKAYFGTTDTVYQGDKDHVVTTREDAEYLIHAVNNFFPSAEIRLQDIESSWAGLRPLIHQEGKAASEISRKDEIFMAPDGLISIAGGKLTGYRVMAKKIVDRVIKGLGNSKNRTVKKCRTKEIRLTQPPLVDEKEIEIYLAEMTKKLARNKLPASEAKYLILNYGKASDKILDKMEQFDDRDPAVKMIRAELDFTFREE
ncbi:MAG: glycerol-3-phosphate dehydrogenase/oxidase, partial [Bacteroidales bacterium]|nr:glycerol-3-phosphate dehydrogenase/oxidase [Bacteroidales bacterium]